MKVFLMAQQSKDSVSMTILYLNMSVIVKQQNVCEYDQEIPESYNAENTWHHEGETEH